MTDPQGAPLPGVIVTSDKDVALALTNEAGEFTLKSAVDNKKLKFRLLGYKNVEVQPEEAMKVEMETDISNVGEIIDLGYSKKSRVLRSRFDPRRRQAGEERQDKDTGQLRRQPRRSHHYGDWPPALWRELLHEGARLL